jgi:hypothetical protein
MTRLLVVNPSGTSYAAWVARVKLLFTEEACGPRGIRTLDLLNAIEARSQLRHGPI